MKKHLQINNTFLYNDQIIDEIGIFERYRLLYNPSWLSQETAFAMDIDYFVGSSGEKLASPFVMKFQAEWEKEPTLENRKIYVDTLATVLYKRFGTNWDKIAEALELEYNPINNYDMVEEEETDRDNVIQYGKIENTTNNSTTTEAYNNYKETDSVSNDYSTTETTQYNSGSNMHTKVKTKNTDTNTHSVNSFNGVQTIQSVDEKITNTETLGTDNDNSTYNANTGSDSVTNSINGEKYHTIEGTKNNSNIGSMGMQTGGNDTTQDDIKRKLKRSGNIGVTSSQQLLQSELDLRKLNNLIDIIFENVDKILTLAIY